MTDDVIIRYDSPSAREAAIRGMIKAKQEWLSYVLKREKELGIG